ncbi:YadA-like family protein [Pseudomonas nicosulfuronedens]
MNKVYRLVWNAALNTWVVACEFATAKGKNKSQRKRVGGIGAAVASLALAIGVAQPVWSADADMDSTIELTVPSMAVGSSVSKAASVAPSAVLAYSTALGSYAATAAAPSAAVGSTSYAVAPASGEGSTGSKSQGGLLGATLKNSAGSIESHYYSINDNNTQGANYSNDGAVGVNSLAAGVAAKTNGARATAVGYNTSAGAIDSLAVGSGSKTTAIGSMALGFNASAAGLNSIAEGTGASATPKDSIAIGTNAQTLFNDASIAIGKDSVSQSILGPGSVALGSEAKALTSGSVAIGYQAVADEVNPPSAFSGNVAIGRLAHATNTFSDPSEASTAVGNEAYADKGGVALGERSNASGKLSTALGNSASATMDNTVAVGPKAKATATDAVAIGNGANAQHARSVALGVGSTTSATVGTTGIDILGTSYEFAGGTPNSTVSIGNVGNERTLTNLAAGRVSQISTDAINGSQLFAVTQALDTPITFAGNTGSVDKQLGDTLTIKGAGTTAGTYSGANLKTQVDTSGNLNLLMAENPAFNSVTAGGNTTLDSTGLTITNGPSVTIAGIDAGGNVISNVSTGVAGTDAVNVDQLTTAINTSTKTHYYSVNDNGTQGDNYDNDGATGVNSLAAGVGAKAAQDGAVALGSGSVTAAAVATTDTTIAGDKYSFAGSAPTSTVSVGDVGSERTLTNVAAGRISASSTDAINGSQLFATNSAIDKIDAGSVKYDLNTDGTINYNSITLAGDTYNSTTKKGGTRITNIAAGVDGGDAVNVDQLDAAKTHYYSVNDNGTQGANYDNDGATGVNSLAAGVGAKAAQDGAVALGSGSVTAAAVATTDTTIGGDKYSFAGSAPTSTVSVGDVGSERTLTNVAAGRISASSTDAINGSQLFATNSAIDKIDAGSVKYDLNTDGTINYNSITLAGDTYNSTTKKGGTRITNIAAGVDGGDAVNVDQLDAAKTHYYSVNDNGTQGANYDNDGATGVNSLAAGVGAKAAQDGAVALGSGSVTAAAVATTDTTIAGDKYSFAGTKPTSTVSVGGVGSERTITNVAAGRLSASSTDAINGSQLFATNSAIDNIDASVTQNTTDISNLDGRVTNIYDTGTKYFHANSTGTDSVASGQDSVAIGMGAVSSHDGSVALGAGSLADGKTLSHEAYLAGGTAKGEVNIGDRRITGLAAGADDTDAVNVGQLKLAASEATAGAVKYDLNTDGSINYNSVTLGGDTYNSTTKTGGTRITNVARGVDDSDAVNMSQLNETNADVAKIDYTLNFIAGDTSTSYTDVHGTGIRYVRTNETGLAQSDSSAEGAGSTAVGYNATAIGESSLALGREAKANNAGDVALGQGSTTAAAVGTTGTTIQGVDYSFAGTAPTSTVSVGSVGNERTLTNVAAGRLTADSTDGINGSQLYATNQAIENIDINIGKLDKGAVKYVINGDGSIDYNAVSLAGDTYNTETHSGGTRVTNVAAGIDGGDAVNVDQLNTAMSNAETHYYSVNDGGKQGGNYANDGAQGNNSLAAGTNATAKTEGGVALGSDSVAAREAGAEGYVPASATDEQAQAIAATTGTRGALSVGDAENGVYRQITGVAAGSEDSDAVNVAQLKGVVSSTNTDITNIAEGKDGMFQVNNTSNLPKPKPTGKDAVAGGAGAEASGDNAVAVGTRSKATASNSVALGNDSVADRANSVSVGSAGSERQITNLAAGTADTDAVNLSQLNKATGDINNSINNVYSDLKHDLKKQDDTLSAGIAGALAAASLPQPYVPGASMASVGTGNYRGQSALAIGVSRISDNGKWVTKLSGSTDTQGEFGVSVGVGYQW